MWAGAQFLVILACNVIRKDSEKIVFLCILRNFSEKLLLIKVNDVNGSLPYLLIKNWVIEAKI